MNANSSCSHLIRTLKIQIMDRNVKMVSKLQMVDLAGGERIKSSGTSGNA